jgi:group I intron endonuclease
MTQTIQDNGFNIVYINPFELDSGVYKITCQETGHFIIGSSLNCKTRLREHFIELEKNSHWNTHMQNRYNKHKNSWVFEIIESVVPNKLLLRESEQKHIDIHYNSNLCMNINKSAYVPSFTGHTHTIETRKKISINSARKNKPGTMLNKKHKEKTRQKMSISQKLRQPENEETRRKKSIAKIGNSWNKGRKHTQEFRDKIKASWVIRKLKKQINSLNKDSV